MWIFGPKCPKCGSRNVKKVTEPWYKTISRMALYIAFFITALFVRGKKPLLVCRDCGFSWEAR